MGYVVVKAAVCDGCGRGVKNVYKKKTFGEHYYRIWAEQNGWEIRKDGWFCPECRRKPKILTNENGEPYCDTCGSLMGWRTENGIICSSSYIGGPTCYDCMVDHCLHTNCLECEKGNYPDCEHLDRKKAYLEDE